tara:strand:- start:1119 stop:1859 length:741 start_codon:yes stop_codon:yes gene_type:complete
LPEELDLIIHAAWVTTDPMSLGMSRVDYITQNVLALAAVLGFATRNPPDSFVFLSSSGVFSASDAIEGLTDQHRPTGSSPYAEGKLKSEGLVASWASEGLSKTYVVRLGHLFGLDEVVRPTRQVVSLVARWVAEARKGSSLEVRADDPLRDWTYTADLAPALERLTADRVEQSPVHLSNPETLRDSEVASLIASKYSSVDVEVSTKPLGLSVKPPMVPSDLSIFNDFQWTDFATGLSSVIEAEETL